jgi:hypothetical protein
VTWINLYSSHFYACVETTNDNLRKWPNQTNKKQHIVLHAKTKQNFLANSNWNEKHMATTTDKLPRWPWRRVYINIRSVFSLKERMFQKLYITEPSPPSKTVRLIARPRSKVGRWRNRW